MESELNNISNVIFDEFSNGKYWVKYENCDTILIDLKNRNFKLGIISNFDERLYKIITDLKLINYFDFVCIPSNSGGHPKPHKEIFLNAFQKSGLKSHSSLMHVGDDIDLDYRAAISLGFKSIVVNHRKKKILNLNNEDCVNSLIDLNNHILKKF